MKNVLSVVNQKGGVGKTTTVVNLSTALSSLGLKILVIDFDPQGNTSTGFGVDQQMRKKTIYHALLNNEIESCIVNTDIENLQIVTSNVNLAVIDLELSSIKKREYILSNLLSCIYGDYDYIIIDCPPSLNLLTINALVSSAKILIPMQCEFYSLEGLSHLLKTIELIKGKLNPNLSIIGILFTMYDKRNKLTDQVMQDVKDHLGRVVFDTVIPRNVKLAEAPSYSMPAILYDHKCSGAMAYIEFTQELLARYEK
ncbi:MAG: ParA family protein [Rickettsiaceae bacterium]